MPDYGSKEAQEITGVPRTSLVYFTDNQVIVPDVAATRGTGNHRRYSLLNLVEIQLAYVISRSTRIDATGIGALLRELRGYAWTDLADRRNRSRREILWIGHLVSESDQPASHGLDRWMTYVGSVAQVSEGSGKQPSMVAKYSAIPQTVINLRTLVESVEQKANDTL